MRVGVVSKDGTPLMPCKPAKARKLLEGGVAESRYNRLGQFYLQMLREVGRKTQPVKMAIDYGSSYDGYAVGGVQEVASKGMAKMPKKIPKKLEQRRAMRRNRRYRKTWRRKKRFDNRRKGDYWIAPSQKAKVEFREEIIREHLKIYPISGFTVEDIRFNHYRNRNGKHFSTGEIGKKRFYSFLEGVAPVAYYRGWETSTLRKEHNIPKSSSKKEVIPESHANDAVAMLAGEFGQLPEHHDALFHYWQRPEFARRSLHRQHQQRGGIRPSFGGTANGGYFRKGDYVEAEKAGKMHRGWVCGLPTDRTPLVGVMDVYGKRIGQFRQKKVRLLCRKTGMMHTAIPPLSHGRGLLAEGS